MIRAFVGLKDFSGWQFTLTPARASCDGCDGAEGFTRVTQVQYPAAFESVRGACEYYERMHLGWTAARAHEINNPPPLWVEANWLTQWLKAGLIREVTNG
jgi:hypothetical protein